VPDVTVTTGRFLKGLKLGLWLRLVLGLGVGVRVIGYGYDLGHR